MQRSSVIESFVTDVFTGHDAVVPSLGRGLTSLGKWLLVPHFGFVVALAIAATFFGWAVESRVKSIEATEVGTEYLNCRYELPTEGNSTAGAARCEHEGRARVILLHSRALFKMYQRPTAPVRCWHVQGTITQTTWDACYLMHDAENGEVL